MNDHANLPHRILGERAIDSTAKPAAENPKPVDKSRKNTGFAVRRYALEKALAHCSDLPAEDVTKAAQAFYEFLIPPAEIPPMPQIGLDFGNPETEGMALRITASADPRGPVAFSPRRAQEPEPDEIVPAETAMGGGRDHG